VDFFTGKSVELCSTKAPQSFAVRNLFPVGSHDFVKRCVGLIQGEPGKNGRTKTRINKEFLAPPESRGLGREKGGLRSVRKGRGRAGVVWEHWGAVWAGHWQASQKPGLCEKK